MNYCSHCGRPLDPNATFCSNCGQTVPPPMHPNQTYGGYNNTASAQDDGHFGWAVLGFFIPIVGLILYLVWKQEKPRTARRLGRGALFSVIFSVVASLLIYGMAACLLINGMSLIQ